MTWLLDLDGVVWRGDRVIPGSADAIARIRASGSRVGFVTNNSRHPAERKVDKLRSFGIAAEIDDVLTASTSIATIIPETSRVLCIAGKGIVAALVERGIEVIDVEQARLLDLDNERIDSVVVGIREDPTYEDLNLAIRGVLNCRRLLAPSRDPLYPGTRGMEIGGGSLTAAVAYATGVAPEFGGKPAPAMVRLVQERFGQVSWVVGDQVHSDGELARQLGAQFGLVHSGVGDIAGEERLDVPIAREGSDLATLVDSLL